MKYSYMIHVPGKPAWPLDACADGLANRLQTGNGRLRQTVATSGYTTQKLILLKSSILEHPKVAVSGFGQWGFGSKE